MTIKGLLFSICFGLLAVLVLMIVARPWAWARAALARRRSISKTAAVSALAHPSPVLVRAGALLMNEQAQAFDEDEAAVAALLREANVSLARANAYSHKEGIPPLSRLPLYLVIGPEGSGKTSTFLNSGLDPQLLAGCVTSAGSVFPTQLCNLWLAGDAIFIEISGHLFAGDLSRWTKVLRALTVKSNIPGWQFWRQPDEGLKLKGVIAFADAKDSIAATNPPGRDLLDPQVRKWQERFRAIADAFETWFPVYLFISKSDNIPYFPDYCRRISLSESGQVLGCTLTLDDRRQTQSGETNGEGPAKRLTDSFNSLYRRLAEQRLAILPLEDDAARRAGIYEFPRELKRLGAPLVQFMVDVFNPRPLRPGPVLRGYYFTGLCETALRSDPGATTYVSPHHLPMNAAVLFRDDATRMFRAADLTAATIEARRSPGIPRWVFVSEVFKDVILRDRHPLRHAVFARKPNRIPQLLAAAVCWVCFLLCFAGFQSWSRNQHLLNDVAAVALTREDQPTLSALRSLDGLRIRLLELINYAQHGAPWGLRWGLYSGNAILADAKHLYFRRFQDLLLNNLDHSLLSRLAVLPETPGANDTYQPALDILKIHLMISSGACNPKPVFVARMLRRTLNDALPAASSELRTLEEKQIDFYANQLPDDANLCRIIDSPATTEHAREYLRHVRGPERTYPGLLSAVRHKFPRPQRLSDLAPNYSKVLSGPNQVDGAFSRNSWKFVEDSLKQRNGARPDEVCVTGQAQGLIDGSKQDAELTRNLEGIFVRDYAEHWRKFVAGFSVVRYSGPADAARKLEILSDHKSPLLAVLAMTSNQTNFAPPAPEASLLRVGAGDTAEHPAEAQSNPAQITRLFQPVHVAVPPGSDTWVVQANSGYIDALAELGHAMQVIAEGGGDPGSAVYQSARQSYERALNSARQIAKGFKPVGVEGLDLAVQKLLYAPIRMTEAFIVRDLESDLKKRLEIENGPMSNDYLDYEWKGVKRPGAAR